jgi:hypothetical protein
MFFRGDMSSCHARVHATKTLAQVADDRACKPALKNLAAGMLYVSVSDSDGEENEDAGSRVLRTPNTEDLGDQIGILRRRLPPAAAGGVKLLRPCRTTPSGPSTEGPPL